MAENQRFQPIPVSRLNEINDTEGFYVFGYTEKDGTKQSVRFPLSALYPLLGISQEIGDAIDKAPSEKTVKEALGQKVNLNVIYNVSEQSNEYNYENQQVARNAVPVEFRLSGQIIIYRLSSGKWLAEQFIGKEINDWTNSINWKDLGVQLTSESGTSEELATSQKFVTEELAKKADGCRLTEENKLQLTSEGADIGLAIELPSGIVNLSKKGKIYKDKTEARSAVGENERQVGQVITYKTAADGWVLDHFKGDAVAMWLNDVEWDRYVPSKELNLLLNSLENIKGDITVLNEQLKTKVDGAYTEMIDEETYLFFTVNGEVVGDPVLLPAGGGSGGTGSGVTMKVRAIGGTSIVTGKGADALIRWNFTSFYQDDQSETGEGSITISLNGVTIHSGTVEQGDGSFNLKNYINLGRNAVRLKITDNANNARSLNYTVQLAELTLESTFSPAVIYDNSPISFRYTVRGEGTKTIQYFLNDVELSADTLTSSGIQMTKEIAVSKEGVNTLRVKASSVIEGATLNSNELFYEFIYTKAELTDSVLISTFNQTAVKQFDTLQIPYFAYDPFNEKAKVYIYVDDILIETTEVARVLQVWEYRVMQANTVKIELRCGASRKIFDLAVEKSEIGIEEVEADLAFRVKALGKSNASSNRDSWEYGNYQTIFEGFNWVENGWLKDTKGNTALKLTGNAKASINIRPFNTSVLNEGMAYTIEYSTADVADDNAVIIEQFIDGIGIKITPTSISVNSVETGVTSYLDSSEKVSITFLVEKKNQNRLLEIYINGILSRSIQYSESDRFNQTATDLKLSTANQKAVVYVYTIRWYRNSLEDSQILGNYVYDIEDSTQQETIYKRNDIIDAYGNIDYTRAVNDIPCMTIIGKLPTFKGDKQTNTIIFENKQKANASFTAEDVTNDVQGTSSQYYPRKNFKFKFNKEKGAILTDTGEPIQNYALDDSTLPANVFCTKADFAESSGTHNTGLAILGNDILVSVGITTPEQQANPKVRTTIYGYPILIFHKETLTSEPVFIGKYNFNYDKAAEHVFGFADGCESWEFKDNTSEMCLFQSADFDSTYVNDKNQTVPTWTNSLEARYPDGSEDVSKVRKVFEWVISCKGNPAKFKEEAPAIFDIDNLLSYWIITEHYAAVDQRAKNQFLTLYKDKKWRFILYDNDTILGIDNIGTIKFRYDVESGDVIDAGHVWNGWDSELWILVKEAFWPEIVQKYERLRAGKMTYEYSMEIFENHQASKWAERIYNKDGYFKYIEPLINGDVDEEGKLTNYLAELQGSRTTHRKWWLTNRFKYMDSRFKTGSYMKDFVSLRLYTPESYNTIIPNADFNLVTSKSGYTHIKFGQTESAQVRTISGQSFKITAPTGMKFNDTETIIYGASALKDLGDLAAKYLGLVDVGSATRLERLIIGSTANQYSNPNFKNLTLGNNTMLREINFANCPNFGNIDAGSTSASIDLSKLLILETINASNTALKSIMLPESGTLKNLILPATITNLTLRNQTELISSSFILEGKSNIQTLVVENTPAVNGYLLAKEIIATNYNNPLLKAIRLTDVNINDADDSHITKLAMMDGIDQDGNLLANSPFISGTAYFSTMTQYSYDLVIAKFPYLAVEVGRIITKINFDSREVETLALATYDTTQKGYLNSEDVEGKTWTPSLASINQPFKFEEIMYWIGGTATISNIPNITSAAIRTNSNIDNARYVNCVNLNHLVIDDDKENITNVPKISTYNWRDCANMQDVTLYGDDNRYSLSKGKIALLAKYWIFGDFYVDRYCNSLIANIGNTKQIESSRGLPLQLLKYDGTATTESALNTNFLYKSLELKNIYQVSIDAWFEKSSMLNKTITVNGICRGSDIAFNNSRYSYFNHRPNPASYAVRTESVTINAETAEDKDLCLFELFWVYIRTVTINAKCTPDTPVSKFAISEASVNALLGTVIFGKYYAPALVTMNYSKKLNFVMVIKASESNGVPYMPTCEIPGTDTIKTLYVPDERLNDYLSDTAWMNCAAEILPLSSSPYN